VITSAACSTPVKAHITLGQQFNDMDAYILAEVGHMY
jgi:hypothetical protein